MHVNEIKSAIDLVIDQCDTSPEQQSVKGVLLALRGAIVINRQGALHHHVSAFAKQELADIQILRNQQQASLN